MTLLDFKTINRIMDDDLFVQWFPKDYLHYIYRVDTSCKITKFVWAFGELEHSGED